VTPTAQIVAIVFIVVLFAVAMTKTLFRRRLSTEQKLRVIEALDTRVMYSQIVVMAMTVGAMIALVLGAYAVAMDVYAAGFLAMATLGFLNFQHLRRLDLPTGYVVVSGVAVAVMAFGSAACLIALR
jgi:uncharacterized membrane protein